MDELMLTWNVRDKVWRPLLRQEISRFLSEPHSAHTVFQTVADLVAREVKLVIRDEISYRLVDVT